ncbi:MAG: M48 family metalloprotease, partial [Desulfobacterales bacterium]
NATYVNAYAFPGGSIAATRGILLALENEAELAALLGHELGHVNARHTAEQMTKGVFTQALVGGVSVLAGTQSAALGQLASQVGMFGAGALLASYSRDNEREADALGMDYMVQAGYGAPGFVGMMDMLRNLSKHKPGAIELMFATHPMSDERYATAVDRARTQYSAAQELPLNRERYMDQTARLRAKQGAIEEMQKGEKEMALKKFDAAEAHFRTALKQAPDDYAGLTMMALCQVAQKDFQQAGRFANRAKQVYPQEAQAYIISGFAQTQQRDFEAAYQDFRSYDQLLPGNPNLTFFKGYSLEGMQRLPEAADQYHRYLQAVNRGDKAQYAYQRLVQWGYVK